MANSLEILDELRALEAHYNFRVVRSAEEHERWLRDYIEDLAAFDIEAIRAGCAKWRRSDAKKFPTSGQLLPMVRGSVEAPKVEASPPWRPLSDAEYEALSLREKIRHHTILAHECSSKAGPMFRSSGPQSGKGQHLTPEDMPPEWHELKRRAKGHTEEANRLRSYLRMQDRSA